MEKLLDKATEIADWVNARDGLKALFDGECGALLMHFKRKGIIGRSVVLKLFERKRMRRWRVDGVEILAQRLQHDGETGELVAVHGQWARDEGEHEHVICAAINWLDQQQDDSIGGAERSSYLV